MKNISILILTLLFSNSLFAKGQDEEISVSNSETGIKDYDFKVSDDNLSIDIAYSTMINPMQFSKAQGFRGQLTWYKDTFNLVGYAASNSININSASRISGNFDGDVEKLSVLEIGPGVSYRSYISSELLGNPQIYEESMVAFTYTGASSGVIDNSYSGFGMVASYALFYRTSKSFHWSLRADYHLHSVEYRDEANLQDVEATLSWMTSSFGMGFYF